MRAGQAGERDLTYNLGKSTRAANTGTGNDDKNRNLSTEGAPSTCFMSQHETTATFTDPVPQNLVKTWEEHGKTMAHIPKP